MRPFGGVVVTGEEMLVCGRSMRGGGWDLVLHDIMTCVWVTPLLRDRAGIWNGKVWIEIFRVSLPVVADMRLTLGREFRLFAATVMKRVTFRGGLTGTGSCLIYDGPCQSLTVPDRVRGLVVRAVFITTLAPRFRHLVVGGGFKRLKG